MICCFAAWRPSLSHCLFCCLWGCCGTSCCFMRGICHHGSIVVLLRLTLHLFACGTMPQKTSCEVQLGGLDDTKRVSHSLFIDQMPSFSVVLEWSQGASHFASRLSLFGSDEPSIYVCGESGHRSVLSTNGHGQNHHAQKHWASPRDCMDCTC